jgi:DNA-binding transcriptional regulator GbsR (MarR family)
MIRQSDLNNLDYFQVPKWIWNLFIEKKISQGTFKAYVLMYDRIRLSSKNGWIDEEGHVFIKYSYDELCEDLKCSRQSVSNTLKEMTEFGLIEVKKNFGDANTYYLTIKNTSQENFTDKDIFTSKNNFTGKEKYTSKENLDYNSLENLDYRSQENYTSLENLTSTKNLTHSSLENLTHSSLENLDAINNNFNKNNSSNNNIKKNTHTCETENQKLIPDWIPFKKPELREIFSVYLTTMLANNKMLADVAIMQLKRMSQDEDELIEIVSNAVLGGYKTFRALDKKTIKTQATEEKETVKKTEYTQLDDSWLDKLL